MVEFHYQNWQEAFDQTYLLFEKIRTSNFIPEVIVGVARGGWIPARLLSDFFTLKFTANVKVEAYQLIGEMEVEPKIVQDINAPIANKRVLIVDDIADSGASLEVVIKLLEEKGVRDYRTATLFYKPRSVVVPHFYITKTEAWVIFPWEIFETMEELSEMWYNEGLARHDIRKKFKAIKIPAAMVNSYFMNET